MKLDACEVAPSDWNRLAIKDVCQRITSGGTPSRKNPEFFENGSVPWVKTKELSDGFLWATEEMITEEAVAKSSAKRLPPDTVLLAMYGATVGMLGILGREMTCNQACCAMLVKPGFDRDFLFYQLLAHRGQLQGLATGAAQQNLSGQQIKECLLPFPPEQEQRRIGTILRTLDNRIDLLRETNATLEAIAQALFKSWFVDFDPVHARARGEQPEGLPEPLAALFPDSFEESPLGLVPRGWRMGLLGDVAETARKQIQPGAMTADTLYVGLEHIPRQSLGLDAWGTAEELESAKSCFEKGDILFGKLRPYFHKIVIAPFAGVCSTDILVCRAKEPDYYGFVAMHLFSTELVAYADRLSNGAKMPRVNWKDLADYPVVIPPSELALAYAEVVQPMFDQITDNVLQAKTLATLRDTLLPRLISGQLRLPEAEALVEEAQA